MYYSYVQATYNGRFASRRAAEGKLESSTMPDPPPVRSRGRCFSSNERFPRHFLPVGFVFWYNSFLVILPLSLRRCPRVNAAYPRARRPWANCSNYLANLRRRDGRTSGPFKRGCSAKTIRRILENAFRGDALRRGELWRNFLCSDFWSRTLPSPTAAA